MVKRYKGGLMSSTEDTTSIGDSRGMWGTVQATQARNTGNWPGLLATETPGSGSGAGFANGFMTVSNVSVTDSSYNILNDTPNISTSGGYIKLTGRGFASGCVVYVGGTPATSTTFISSTEVRAQIAAATSNTLMVYVVNPDGSTGIKLNSLVFSGTPTWVTGTTLNSQLSDTAFSINFSATSDSAITAYTVDTGSSLPPGTTLYANGLFTGTVTGISSDTTYSFAVVATDTENQDTSRTFSVTVGTGDAGFYLTSSIFNSDGNNWVRDSSVNNAFVTVGNDTRPTAFSPYNSNWSGFFDGTGDYLNLTGSANLAFGTSDFTIELFAYFNSVTVEAVLYDGRASGVGSGAQPAIILNGTSTSKLSYYVSGATRIISDAALTTGQWYHIVLSRVSSVTRMFINGVSQTQTWSDTTTYTNPANRPVIGAYADSLSSGYMNGYISNLRVLNGTGYTSVTVPTSRLTTTSQSASNCQLLTLQDNRFIDNSTNAFTITPNGDVSNRSFGPFTETDIVSGSAYFDGTGDYLTIPDSAALELGAGDFCVECWIYPTSVSGTAVVIDKRSGGYAPLLLWRSSSTLQIYMSLNGSSWGLANAVTVGALVVNQWYHVAVFRVGTSLYTSFNGVVSLVTASGSGTLVNNATNWYIGTETNGSTNPWTGYIADMRFVVGSGVYTSANFTPATSSLTSVANTQFLSLQYRTGENNHRFIDEAGTKALIARVNEVHQGSFSPHSPAGWSGYFDGTGDYLAFSTYNTTFGAGDFTVECWVNMPVITNTFSSGIIGTTNYNGVDRGWALDVVGASGYLRFYLYNSSGTGVTLNTTTLLPANQWTHLAAVRSGTTVTIYMNGVSIASGTNATSDNFSAPIYIGTIATSFALGQSGYSYAGYISNARIVVGTAVYTSNFTPPTSALTAIANTQLLTLQDNRFKDNSTNAFTVTQNGGARIHPFSPFRASGAYSPTLHGGSAYFDGGTDYLTVPANSVFAFGTGDFTVECWAYITTTNTYMPFVQSDAVGASTNNKWFFATTSTTLLFQTHSSGGFTASTPWTPGYGSWQHFAAVRQSGTMRLFVNGVSGTVTVTGTPSGYSLSQNGLAIGGMSSPYYLTGYISGLRLVTGQAVFTGNFAIPTAPPGLTQTLSTNVAAITSNVTLLTNFTNAGIVDYTGRNNIYTFTGPNIRSSNVQSKFGTGSLFFTGGYQYVFIGPGNNAAHPPLLPTIGDYTVECWVYCTASDTTLMCLNTTLSVYAAVRVALNSNGSVSLLVSTGSPNVINVASSAGTFAFNTWQHLAIVRYGGTHSVYVNGTSVIASTTIAATTAVQAGVESVLGCIDNRNNSDFASFYQGYIDDFRTTRYARYTANFTAPTTAHLTR